MPNPIERKKAKIRRRAYIIAEKGSKVTPAEEKER